MPKQPAAPGTLGADVLSAFETGETPASPGTTAPTTGAAFLLRIEPGCSGDPASLAGRIQELSTGDGGNFRSAEDLFGILRRMLTPQAPEGR